MGKKKKKHSSSRNKGGKKQAQKVLIGITIALLAFALMITFIAS